MNGEPPSRPALLRRIEVLQARLQEAEARVQVRHYPAVEAADSQGAAE